MRLLNFAARRLRILIHIEEYPFGWPQNRKPADTVGSAGSGRNAVVPMLSDESVLRDGVEPCGPATGSVHHQ